MSLANPMALVLLGLAAPVIGFYILKIRLRRTPVSTLLFWRKIFDEKKPRSLWQRLRHLLSLLLQLVFLALLVAAVSDPIFRWRQKQSRRVVVIVDDSAGMAATDLAPSRLEAARARALRLIEGMRQGDETAIVAASRPRVVCGATDHERTLKQALASIVQTDAPARMTAAVELARRLLSGSPKTPRIVVLTDAAFDAAAELAGSSDVELVALGARTGNVGITQLQARRSVVDPVGYEIMVEVENAADEPAQLRLELELGAEPIDVVPLTLAPGARSVQMFEKTSAEGGRIHAHLDKADALMADNDAWAVLPRRARQKVSLATPGNLFLEKVFEALPAVDLEVVRVAPETKPAQPAPAAAGVVHVYHRQTPETLPAGNVFVIDPLVSGPYWTVGEAIKQAVVAKQDRDSAYMANIRLDNVALPESRKLSFPAGARLLAETAAGDAILAAIERPGLGKVVVLGVDLDKSDLPLQTAFPILAANVLSEFGGAKGELRPALAAGSTAELELAADLKAGESFVLHAPDGRETPITLTPGSTKATVGPLDRHGVWSVLRRRDQDRPSARPAGAEFAPGDHLAVELACNIADRRETDLRAPEGFTARPPESALALAVRPVWYYLLATAWLLTCWEWLLYQRRWID